MFFHHVTAIFTFFHHTINEIKMKRLTKLITNTYWFISITAICFDISLFKTVLDFPFKICINYKQLLYFYLIILDFNIFTFFGFKIPSLPLILRQSLIWPSNISSVLKSCKQEGQKCFLLQCKVWSYMKVLKALIII